MEENISYVKSCLYCHMDSAGNHSYGCPTRGESPIYAKTYYSFPNDTEKLDEILKLLKEIKNLLTK